MWELDYEQSWVLKRWIFWTVVLEKTLESLLDCKEIQPVHPKGNQSWIFIEKTVVEAETPTLWPRDAKNWLTGKDPDAGKDWRWEEKGMTRGWDGWMASLTQWTWVWVSSRSWWWTGRPGMLHSMGLQRVGHDWVTELNWVVPIPNSKHKRHFEQKPDLILSGGIYVSCFWTPEALYLCLSHYSCYLFFCTYFHY